MPAPPRIVDSHQHVFWHGRDDRGLIADMDEHGIEYAWLLTWEVPPDEADPAYDGAMNPANVRPDGTHAGVPLRDLLVARDRYPQRFVLGYCPDPRVGNAPARLRAAAAMHEVKVCGEWKFRVLIDDPRCLELFHAAGELQMPVVLHLDVPYLNNSEGRRTYQPIWHGGTIENLERALQACPETNFIGHAPGFWREISGDAAGDPATYPGGPVREGGKLCELFDRNPNLFADLSAGSALNALRRDPAHADRLIVRFQDRLLFGRDYYGGELLEFLRSRSLANEVADKIFHQNAEKLIAGPRASTHPPFGPPFFAKKAPPVPIGKQ